MDGVFLQRSARLITSALLLSLSSAAFPASEKISSQSHSYLRAPTPAWVMPAKLSAAGAPAGAGPVSMAVLDDQINLLQDKPVHYMHYRLQVSEKPGLEMVSQIPLQFNPAYETLTLHELYVVRNGARLDRLKSAKVQLIQREEQLNQLLYDGVVTALIVVPDVRVGDALDIAYSVRGSNPIFKNHYSDFSLALAMPLNHRSVRVLYPATRDLHYKVLAGQQAPAVKTVGGHRELQLTEDNVAAIPDEDQVPRWHKLYPALQVSDWSGWDDVEAWGLEQFQVPTDLSPELRSVIDEIRKRASTDEARAMAALAFVQDEIRYFGIELGTSSHKPNHPNVTMAQRFGDCKDKTLLLVTLLRQLGIEAKPATVSYTRLRGLADQLPAATAFDHVITQVTIDGHVYWLDGTRSLQGHKLATLGFEPYGKALVIGANAHGLSDVEPPPGYAPHLDYEENIVIKNYAEPVELSEILHYYGGYAENLRTMFHTKSEDEISKGFEADVVRFFPKAKRSDPLKMEDDPETNTVTVTEHYTVPDFLKYDNGTVEYRIIESHIGMLLRLPQNLKRTSPIDLTYPLTISSKHTIFVQRDLSNMKEAPAVNVRSPYLALTTRNAVEKNQFSMNYELRMLREAVPQPEIAAYIDKVHEAQKYTEYHGKMPLFDSARALPIAREKLSALLSSKHDHLDNMTAGGAVHQVIADDVIAHAGLSGGMLAQAYADRSVAQDALGDHVAALADIDRAIALDASRAEWNADRASTLGGMGRYADALDAYARRLALDSTHHDFSGEGRASFMLGRYDQAEQYFTKTLSAGDNDDPAYNLIWLYMSAARQGKDGRAAISAYISQTDLVAWPGPVVRYLSGEIDEAGLLSEAQKDDKESRLQSCEAYFFIGENELSKSNTEAARRDFQRALGQKATMYLEDAYARNELARLH